MEKTPGQRIEALQKELADTREAAVSMLHSIACAVAKAPEGREQLAQMYQDIADGRQRSRITGQLAGMAAERLRGDQLAGK